MITRRPHLHPQPRRTSPRIHRWSST